MKNLRLCALALLFALSLVGTGPNEAKACSAINLRALEICYQRCWEIYPGDSLYAIGARAACFTGCRIGCIIYGVD